MGVKIEIKTWNHKETITVLKNNFIYSLCSSKKMWPIPVRKIADGCFVCVSRHRVVSYSYGKQAITSPRRRNKL